MWQVLSLYQKIRNNSLSDTDKYSAERITEFHAWTPKLFSFNITRPTGYRFTPGQFARLGVSKPDGTQAWRAYSIVSADYDEHLAFYSIAVPDGEFTSVLAGMGVGSTVLLDKTPFGFLTTSRFTGGRDLWLLSTGTGIAPFISILHDLAVWEQYRHIVVVHCVRDANELVYRDTIAAFHTHEYFGEQLKAQPDKLKYIPVVTREPIAAMLNQRITTLIENGALEAAAGLTIDPIHSRVMLCGNPEMVTDTRKVLKARGLTVSRNAAPGNIAVENYW